jgi:proteasome lid subunit RPN8/RPN11
VHLAAGIAEAIETQARAEAPRECCGLLVGHEGRIHRAVPTKNIAPRPTRYEVDPVEHFRVIRDARAERLEVLGAYHSHPAGPPAPSPTDLEEAQTAFLYIIATPSAEGAGCDLRGYWLDEGNFQPVRLVFE